MSDVVPTLLSGGIVSRTDLSGGRVTRTGIAGGQVLRTDISGGVAPVATAPVLPAWVTHAWESDLLVAGPIDSWIEPLTGAEFTQVEAPTRRPEQMSPGLRFDGVDDRMNWATGGVLDAGLQAATYTIGMCAKFLGVGSASLGIALGNTTTFSVPGFALWIDDRVGLKRIGCVHHTGINPEARLTSCDIALIGATYHTIFFVAAGSGVPGTIYIDGVGVGAYLARPNLIAAAGAVTVTNYRVGESTGGFPADMLTNGVYIAHNYAASAAEILALHDYRVAKGTLP